MGIPSEEEATGHDGSEHKELPVSYAEMARKVASDDSSSDDDGEKLKSKSTKKQHAHYESSSSSSSSSSSKSSHHHHHHHDGDDEARAHEEEDEVVSKNGDHDNAHEKIVEETAAPEKIVEEPTINGANVEGSDNEPASSPGEKASAIEEVKEFEEREIGDEVVVEQEKGIRDESEGDGALEEASLDSLQESETKEYDVVVSETKEGDGSVGTSEVASEPEPKVEMEFPEPVDEVAVVDADSPQIEDKGDAELVSIETSAPEEIAESEPVAAESAEDDSAKDVIEEASVEKRKISDFVVAESEKGSHDEEEEHSEFVSSEKSVPAETEEVQNGNAQEVVLERSTEHSSEIEGKSEHDECFEGEEDIQALPRYRDLSVEVASPLELKNRLLKPNVTPSPPKRESSVYKIVMALEGLQIGEKCIHGEIDHGVCHQRYGDKKPSSPSFSPSTRRDTSRDSSISPKDSDRAGDASPSPSPEVRVSDGEKREVDIEWSFVQHDSNSTMQLSSSTKTETYTDTVLFRRDDGFLPRTPGRSPLSGSQSMRAVFSQAEASSSTTPTLKIVHEFPAEQDGASSATLEEGESEVERILRLQETHDLVCPVCRSCITKRVILRKRKRTTAVSSIEKWETEVQDDEESSGEQVLDTNAGDTDVEEYENYGCLSCFTFLFRRERSTQRTEVPRAPEAAAAAPVEIPSNQSAAALPDTVAALPPAPTGEDYDNRCLPIFFTWRRKTTTSSTDSEIIAPLLSQEERAEDSSVEVVRTESRDVSAEDNIQQISTSQEEQVSTPEIKQISTSESKEISASEIQQASTSEVQQRPDAGTLTLPAAPGVAEGVQIPVVVVESREDRLCFPFLWRRATKSTQVHPELLQTLLTKKDVKQKSDEVEQQSTETKRQVDDVKQESQQTEDFSRIEDDLWMRREVLLEVPVSVSPQEEPRTPGSSSQTSEIPAQPDTSVTTHRVTEEERRADCLCFPSWSSSETTTEETETNRITNSQQGALSTWASVTEATEKLQTSASQRVIPSTDLKKAVTTATAGTEGSEISLSSPSFKGAVLPVVSGTQDREAQKASLNCMEILIPSYPWGPPGAGRMKEVTEKAEEHTGNAASTSFQFSTVGQVDSKSPLILPGQAVAESSKQPGSQPNQSPAEIILAQTTERREDSTCFPISLPTLSWRRQELISGEIVDGSSKTKPAEVTSSATSESKPSVASENKSYNSSVSSETKSWVTTETKSWVTSETKSSVSSETQSSMALESKSSVDSESKSFGTAETVLPEGKVVEKEFDFGDIEVSRNQDQQREQNYNDSAVELVDEEAEEPLVRKPPASKKLTPSEVEPLPVEVNERVIVSEETDNSSLSEILERDLSFSQDLTRTENVSTVLPVGETHEDETREKGTWNCCLPSYSQLAYQPIEGSDIAVSVTPKQTAAPASSDALPGASISHVSDKTESTSHAEDTRETAVEEEAQEKGSWNCCLPSYSQLAYQPIDSVTENQAAAPASSDALPVASISHVSDKESTFHEEVTKETTIDARIKTEVTTTRFSTEEDHAESIDSVRVDTTVSYVHGKVQHDKGDAEGTLLLDDHPTLTFHPVDPVPAGSDLEDSKTQPPLGPVYSTGYAALSRFLEDEEADDEINERLADASRQDVGQKEILLSEAVAEVEQDISREDIQKSEAVTKTKQDIGDEIKLVTTVPALVILPDSAQQDIAGEHERDGRTGRIQEEEEDGSCCGPSSKWFWNRRKFTTEEAQLREPLLGRDSAQLGKPIVLQPDSEVDSQDSSAHVTIQQTHEVTETRTGDKVIATEEDWCHCFPWSGRDLTDTVGTIVTVTADDTVIEVEGTDATSTLAAATHAAEDAGMMDEPLQEGDYLKSIVYGGLDVSLTSLGVVAAAAGGDAKTRNILALGLSNLIFGFLTFFYKIQDLHKERPTRFHESVGPRFWINSPLAMLSFLFFGALPVLTFAFSFRELNDHDYKMAATVLASTIAVIFLGCGKVAAKMTEMSYRRTLTTLITTGIVASVAGFYTGEYISKLLTKYGILDE